MFWAYAKNKSVKAQFFKKNQSMVYPQIRGLLSRKVLEEDSDNDVWWLLFFPLQKHQKYPLFLILQMGTKRLKFNLLKVMTKKLGRPHPLGCIRVMSCGYTIWISEIMTNWHPMNTKTRLIISSSILKTNMDKTHQEWQTGA